MPPSRPPLIPPWIPAFAGMTGMAMTGMAVLLALPSPAASQPHIDGAVTIDLDRGSIRGDVCISHLPARDTIHLLLNRALEIGEVDGTVPRVISRSPEPGGATIQYAILRENRDRPLCVRYAGREALYDVAQGEFRDSDESSLIAFNGGSVRGRGVARWLPTPLDPAIGLAAEAVTFRLEIECGDCATIFLNGGPPTAGPAAAFESNVAREPYLVAGDLEVNRVGDSRMIGASSDIENGAALLAVLDGIRDFYDDFLGIPFGPLPDLVFLDAVREPRRGQIWGFFSDPAFTIIGMTPAEMVGVLRGDSDRSRIALLGFLAHEMAHRHFAWTLGRESPQRDLFGEPFAAYLELAAIRALVGDAEYRTAVRDLATRLDDGLDLAPVDRAGPDELRHDRYRYVYLPLVLLSLEREVGEDAMRRILRDVLQAPADERAGASFGWLERIAIVGGLPPTRWRAWAARCLPPERVGGCVR